MVTRGGKEGATWLPDEGRRWKHGDLRWEGGGNMVTRGGKERTTC